MRQEAGEERVGLWGSTSCFVSILRAVGSQCPFFELARSSGFGMENEWDVHIDHGRYSGKRWQPALGNGFREKWKDECDGDEVAVFDDWWDEGEKKRDVVRTIPCSLVCIIGGAVEPSTQIAMLGKDSYGGEWIHSLNKCLLIFHCGACCNTGLACLLSAVRLIAAPGTVARQAPLSMEFCTQEHWSGLSFASLGDLPDSGVEPRSPALQVDTLLSEPQGKPTGLGAESKTKPTPWNCRIYILEGQINKKILRWVSKILSMSDGLEQCLIQGRHSASIVEKICQGKWIDWWWGWGCNLFFLNYCLCWVLVAACRFCSRWNLVHWLDSMWGAQMEPGPHIGSTES